MRSGWAPILSPAVFGPSRAAGRRPDELSLALCLRLRPPGQRAEPGAVPALGQYRLEGPALEEFARWADPTSEKLLAVLVDNAGWHVGKRLALLPNVALHRLPPCTPAEPPWPLVREAVVNQGYDELSAMADRPPRGRPRGGRLRVGSSPQ